jgi:hypothetical protein
MAVPIFFMNLKHYELQGQRTQVNKIKCHVIMLGTVRNYRVPLVELTTFLHKWNVREYN